MNKIDEWNDFLSGQHVVEQSPQTFPPSPHPITVDDNGWWGGPKECEAGMEAIIKNYTANMSEQQKKDLDYFLENKMCSSIGTRNQQRENYYWFQFIMLELIWEGGWISMEDFAAKKKAEKKENNEN